MFSTNFILKSTSSTAACLDPNPFTTFSHGRRTQMNQAKPRWTKDEEKQRWNTSIQTSRQFNLSNIFLQFVTRRLSCPTDLFSIFEWLDLDCWTITIFVGYQPGTTLPARVEVRKMRKRHRFCSEVPSGYLSSSADFDRHGLLEVLQTSCEVSSQQEVLQFSVARIIPSPASLTLLRSREVPRLAPARNVLS